MILYGALVGTLLLVLSIDAGGEVVSLPKDQAIYGANEQWKKMQTRLLLNDRELVEILRGIGDTISIADLVQLEKAVQRLSALQVPFSDLLPQDALLIDAQHHSLLAENEYVRVMRAHLKVGETCPLHLHQWPSVYLILSGDKFITHHQDGTAVAEEWGPGVYELPADTELMGFTNCGTDDFEALCIELKKTLPNTK